jgi:tetratricopeptide (TPR) repeat protein
MRRLVVITSAVLFLALAANAQVRGTGRLQGNVFDKSTGQPIAGATVTIALPKGATAPIVVKTDSKGHWAALGMTPGVWYIDITAPGHLAGRGTASVSELGQTPAIKTDLEPEAAAQPVAAPVPTAPSIPKEAVDAVKEGEQLLKTAPGATADAVKENAKHAVADFEKALPMIREDTPQLKDVKNQVQAILAQAYYRAGDLKNAIATLEKLDVADPMPATPDTTHTNREILLANLYLENGQLDQGRAVLQKLPPTAIADPTAYINVGILFLNKKNPTDAATYFTKAIALDPKRADNYYYRGLAEVQLKKYKEAKTDLEQVLALAPDSPEAHDAKQLLASLK